MSIDDEKVYNLECHWGITYATDGLCFNKEPLLSKEDGCWVLGFDTGHCDDYVPGLDIGGIYRDKDYVISNVKKLIEQIKTLEFNHD